MRRISSPVALATAMALTISGCATTVEPRAFSPVVQPPPTDLAAFERDFSACASQASEDVAVFYRSHPELKPVEEDDVDFTPSGGGAIGPGDMGSGGLALIGLMIAAVRAGGRSQVRQAHRQATEQDIQAAMTSCLKARGHTVTAWRPIQDGKASAAAFRTPTQPTGRAYLVHKAEEYERLADRDPKGRTAALKMAAEVYGHLAEGAANPEEKARLSGKAAEARRKADEPGPSAITLRMPAYSAVPGPSALTVVPPRSFSVEAARDARPGSQSASRIGEISDSPSGEVDTIPPPARLIQDVFSAELGAAGHRPSADNPDIRIVPEMRRFELSAEGKVLPLDVSAAVDITVNLQAPQQPERSRDYSAKCAAHAGWWSGPNAEFMTRLVGDCLQQIGSQFRQDLAVREFMDSIGPQK